MDGRLDLPVPGRTYPGDGLAEIWTEKPERDGRNLLAEEKRLLRVLRVARRRQRAATRHAGARAA